MQCKQKLSSKQVSQFLLRFKFTFSNSAENLRIGSPKAFNTLSNFSSNLDRGGSKISERTAGGPKTRSSGKGMG